MVTRQRAWPRLRRPSPTSSRSDQASKSCGDSPPLRNRANPPSNNVWLGCHPDAFAFFSAALFAEEALRGV
ncbi:hypothetical protein NL676_024905 [Syzygium grande]|nr:hypothetical protein NL676_024905 [Syzygium grande]